MKKRCRYFASFDVAAKLVPKIRARATELVKKGRLISILDSIELLYEDDYDFFETDIKKNKALYKMSLDFYNGVEKLFKMGCILRDSEKGYVDIFCQDGERTYFLCYNINEKEICHWHELDEECTDRKKISLGINQNKVSKK